MALRSTLKRILLLATLLALSPSSLAAPAPWRPPAGATNVQRGTMIDGTPFVSYDDAGTPTQMELGPEGQRLRMTASTTERGGHAFDSSAETTTTTTTDYDPQTGRRSQVQEVVDVSVLQQGWVRQVQTRTTRTRTFGGRPRGMQEEVTEVIHVDPSGAPSRGTRVTRTRTGKPKPRWKTKTEIFDPKTGKWVLAPSGTGQPSGANSVGSLMTHMTHDYAAGGGSPIGAAFAGEPYSGAAFAGEPYSGMATFAGEPYSGEPFTGAQDADECDEEDSDSEQDRSDADECESDSGECVAGEATSLGAARECDDPDPAEREEEGRRSGDAQRHAMSVRAATARASAIQQGTRARALGLLQYSDYPILGFPSFERTRSRGRLSDRIGALGRLNRNDPTR